MCYGVVLTVTRIFTCCWANKSVFLDSTVRPDGILSLEAETDPFSRKLYPSDYSRWTEPLSQVLTERPVYVKSKSFICAETEASRRSNTVEWVDSTTVQRGELLLVQFYRKSPVLDQRQSTHRSIQGTIISWAERCVFSSIGAKWKRVVRKPESENQPSVVRCNRLFILAIFCVLDICPFGFTDHILLNRIRLQSRPCLNRRRFD